jgi:hypothetical protein
MVSSTCSACNTNAETRMKNARNIWFKIIIRKENFELDFNVKIQTAKGVLCGIKNFNQKEFCGVAENAMTTNISIMEAHDKLEHIGVQAVKLISVKLWWELTGKQQRYVACAEGIACQKDIIAKVKILVKTTENSTKGCVYLDISWIRSTKFQDIEKVNKPFWRIIVDEQAQLKYSEFPNKKRDDRTWHTKEYELKNT